MQKPKKKEEEEIENKNRERERPLNYRENRVVPASGLFTISLKTVLL